MKRPTHRDLLSVVLSKAFSEIFAIGTGIGGILYTLQGIAPRALSMDALSAIAAIVSFVIGIGNLRYLKEHDLLRRAVLLPGLGTVMSIAILAWHYGFHLRVLLEAFGMITCALQN